MKRIIKSAFLTFLTLAVCLSLFACGGEKNEESILESSSQLQSDTENESSAEESEMNVKKGISVADIPAGIDESAAYTVKVRYGADGEEISVLCYNATVGIQSVSYTGAGEIKNDVMSFCYFESDYSEDVYVTVTPANSFEKCVIRPLDENISFTENDGTVTFALSSACKLSVEFDDAIYTNLFIYADENETETFAEGDEGVIYYGPGVHEAGEIAIASNQTLYLAPGAFVYGYVTCSDAENVTIKGRGILCGSELAHRMDGERLRLCSFDNCKNVTIEGVIFLDSPTWTLRTYCCEDVVINNLKEICWYYNSDGLDICSCKNVQITDCFIRNYDDNISLKAYESQDCTGITVSDCIFWADCAHNMLVGPEALAADYENRYIDITFSGITILEQKQSGDFYKGVMALTCTDNSVFDNITWENIKIERMSEGAVINFRFSKDYGTYYGKSITGITVKNVVCDCVPARGDSIIGLTDKPIGDVTIENYTVNGKKITFDDSNFSSEFGYIDSLTIEGEVRKVTTGIEEPVDSYAPYLKIVSTDDGNGTLQATFTADKFEAGKTYTIKTTACFEGIDQTVGTIADQGLGYVNCYVYSADGTLYSFYDFAKCNTGDAGWKEYDLSFSIPSNPGTVTVSIGFWEASGTVSCSEIEMIKPDGSVMFGEDFSEGLDKAVWKEIYPAKSVDIITEDD